MRSERYEGPLSHYFTENPQNSVTKLNILGDPSYNELCSECQELYTPPFQGV